MDTGFRLDQTTPRALLAGVLVLVGTPAVLFALVYVSDAPAVIAWWADLALLYYFAIGAYLHARYGGIWNESPSE